MVMYFLRKSTFFSLSNFDTIFDIDETVFSV